MDSRIHRSTGMVNWSRPAVCSAVISNTDAVEMYAPPPYVGPGNFCNRRRVLLPSFRLPSTAQTMAAIRQGFAAPISAQDQQMARTYAG